MARSTLDPRRYDRIARVYDLVEAPMDAMGGQRRRRRCVGGAQGRVLEVGIGTGRNLELYPPDVELVGVDIAAAMLARSARRARRLGREVRLAVADVERLPFPDASFDTVCATCVFCSVADPVAGLAEVARVLRPNGRARLLEHVRPRNPVLGRLADLVTPLSERVVGPALNRRTEDNARRAGLDLVEVDRHGVWRQVLARRAG
jgi:ubiquinone/menaquinone biosynthesis C-methylase UbiE